MALAPCRPSARPGRQRAIAQARAGIPEPGQAIDRLLELHSHNSHGVRWYADRHAMLATLAIGLDCDVRQLCGAFAALSPSTNIDRNHSLLVQLAETGDCSHAYGLAITRGRAILSGAEPLTVLGGRKTRAFYRNLSEPHRSGPVTIDRHAFSILFGRKLNDAELKLLERPGVYAWASGIYRGAARQAGVRPHELQATTWEVWRDG